MLHVVKVKKCLESLLQASTMVQLFAIVQFLRLQIHRQLRVRILVVFHVILLFLIQHVRRADVVQHDVDVGLVDLAVEVGELGVVLLLGRRLLLTEDVDVEGLLVDLGVEDLVLVLLVLGYLVGI